MFVLCSLAFRSNLANKPGKKKFLALCVIYWFSTNNTQFVNYFLTMGIVDKPNPKVGGYRLSSSEDSLHIPQSSDDEYPSSSDSSTTTTPAIKTKQRVLPVPMNFSDLKKHTGRKRFRRYENNHHLEALVEDEELCAVTIRDFIPHSSGVFSKLLTDKSALKEWEEFVESSEESQLEIVHLSHKRNKIPANNTSSVSAEQSFRKIKAGIRIKLRKYRIPFGMLNSLETKIVNFFTKSPTLTYISELLSSFERLLLHAVAQYNSLRSLSFCSQPEKVRLVRVFNPFKEFRQPPVSLVEFLIQRRKEVHPSRFTVH